MVFGAQLQAQEAQSQLPSYPPTGERLRVLADRLDFKIGFAARYQWSTLDEAALYESIIANEFNIATPENSVKWEFVQPELGSFDFTDMDTLENFADTNAMHLHGHPLVWYRQNPPWAESATASVLDTNMKAHIDAVVSRYRGRIGVWDVVNEAISDDGPELRESIFLDAMGEQYIDKAFRQACLADPTATLLYNDFKVGWLSTKADAMFDLVSRLKDRDVPVDGVGMQMHIEHTFNHFEGFSENMQRFADEDLDIYITEFDVGVLNPEQYDIQADVYEEIIQRCLMQPRCEALQIWGVDDFHSWQPFFDPLPFDDDFRIKPAYYGMQRALQTQPVHPEQCELNGSTVSSGAVYPNTNAITCNAVPLTGEFQSALLRYRNPGAQTPSLVLNVNAVEVGRVELTPTLFAASEGDYRTVSFPVTALTGDQTLEIVLEGNAEGVGIDALLFKEPAAALPRVNRTPSYSGTESADRFCGPDLGTVSDGDFTNSSSGSSGGFLGAALPVLSLLLGSLLLRVRLLRVRRFRS